MMSVAMHVDTPLIIIIGIVSIDQEWTKGSSFTSVLVTIANWHRAAKWQVCLPDIVYLAYLWAYIARQPIMLTDFKDDLYHS